jgi:hypothetical protein
MVTSSGSEYGVAAPTTFQGTAPTGRANHIAGGINDLLQVFRHADLLSGEAPPSLEAQRRHGDAPTVVDAADDVVGRQGTSS